MISESLRREQSSYCTARKAVNHRKSAVRLRLVEIKEVENIDLFGRRKGYHRIQYTNIGKRCAQ
jgi:hypothetical protein